MRKVTISIDIELETDMDDYEIQKMAYQYCDDMATDIMSGQGMWPNIDVMVDSDEMTVDKLLNQIEERI